VSERDCLDPPWILKVDILLLTFLWKSVFLLVSELVKKNFTSVGPPGKIYNSPPWKKSIASALSDYDRFERSTVTWSLLLGINNAFSKWDSVTLFSLFVSRYKNNGSTLARYRRNSPAKFSYTDKMGSTSAMCGSFLKRNHKNSSTDHF